MPTAHYESKIYPVTDEPLAPKGCVAKQHLLRVCTHPLRAMVGQSLNYPLSDCVALRVGNRIGDGEYIPVLINNLVSDPRLNLKTKKLFAAILFIANSNASLVANSCPTQGTHS